MTDRTEPREPRGGQSQRFSGYHQTAVGQSDPELTRVGQQLHQQQAALQAILEQIPVTIPKSIP